MADTTIFYIVLTAIITAVVSLGGGYLALMILKLNISVYDKDTAAVLEIFRRYEDTLNKRLEKLEERVIDLEKTILICTKIKQ